METLAPTLWIDANVVDCWVAIMNHEEFVKVDSSPKRHFFTTGCITCFFVLITTQAMIEGCITEKHQWKMFSAEISTQFQNNLAGKSLSEVELAFFPICASGHFYLVVFNIKKGSMIILDNSDCGETYTSKYKDACELLKMFDLAYKFETENDKHSRISIIVNAIKNRAERDPAKNVVENEEGDAVKKMAIKLM
ncbi:ulp1 protease family, C-terminal catalytic domain-containing protein, partial [Tanacetum coccineum]